MNDKKSSEEDLFSDNLGGNEEFDFGEEIQTDMPTPKAEGQRGPNKMVLTIALVAGLGIAGYFAYKYFYAAPATSVVAKAETPTTATETVKAPVNAPAASTSLLQPKSTTTTKAATAKTTSAEGSKEPSKNPQTAAHKPLFPAKEEGGFTENELAGISGATHAAPTSATATKTEAPKTPLTSQIPQGIATTQTAQTPQPLQPHPTSTVSPTAQTTQPAAATTPHATTAASATTAPHEITHNLPPAQVQPASAVSAQETNPQAKTAVATPIPPHAIAPPAITPSAITTAPHSAQPPTAATSPIATVTKPSLSAAPSSISNISKEKLSPMEVEQLNKIMEALSKLNQQMENNLNQVKYLDAYTREISETVNKLNSQISAMDNRILALTNTATSLSKDVGTVRSEVGTVRRALGDEGLYIEPAVGPGVGPGKGVVAAGKEEILYSNATPKRCPPGIMVEEPEFALHAVIPGRAWLKSSSGQIITVTEGDLIGNYGKIIVIDASNGVVLTNSGITFR